MPLPIPFPPPPWTDQDLIVYHGTTDKFANRILSGINVSLGRTRTDFGPGFYTTTLLWQAQSWATQRAYVHRGTKPAVIQIDINRSSLAHLEALAFVRGDFYAEEYWSFVHYCRQGATDHARAIRGGYYDVVYGPVAAIWNQRMMLADTDQISFHTPASQTLLNSSRKSIML